MFTVEHMIRYLFILLDSDKTAADDLMATLDSESFPYLQYQWVWLCYSAGVESLVLAVTSPDAAMVTHTDVCGNM